MIILFLLFIGFVVFLFLAVMGGRYKGKQEFKAEQYLAELYDEKHKKGK